MRRLVAPLLLLALAPLSCISERSSPLDPPVAGEDCRVPAGAIGPNRALVLIRNFTYFPDTLRVRPGTTVTWVNCELAGTDPHTASAGNNSWDSGSLPVDASYAHQFTSAGAHPYFCRPHPFMRGVVLVQ